MNLDYKMTRTNRNVRHFIAYKNVVLIFWRSLDNVCHLNPNYYDRHCLLYMQSFRMPGCNPHVYYLYTVTGSFKTKCSLNSNHITCMQHVDIKFNNLMTLLYIIVRNGKHGELVVQPSRRPMKFNLPFSIFRQITRPSS